MTNLKITGNKVSITAAMEEHVNKKFEKIMDNLSNEATSLHIHFSKNNNATDAFKVSADLKIKGNEIFAEEFGDSGDAFYGMIDELAHNIIRQVEKKKFKSQANRKKSAEIKRTPFEEEPELA